MFKKEAPISMGTVGERAERVMEIIRQRQREFEEESSKENYESPSVHFVSSSASYSNTPSPLSNKALPSKETPKSRFSALAEEQQMFEYDYQSPYNKPKEAYMKGTSPRLSTGETRPSVLCAPGSASFLSPPYKSPEKYKQVDRRITFAQPVCSINILPAEQSTSHSTANESTVLGGSSEIMGVSTSSFDFTVDRSITAENTLRNSLYAHSQDQYGAHTYVRKVSQDISESNLSKSLPSPTVCSPKPFMRTNSQNHYSPVHFNPTSTSSPKCSVTDALTVKEAAGESAPINNFVQKLDQKVGVNSYQPIPTPRHAHQPTTPTSVQTQWRGQHMTPVVQGARADEKTPAPNVASNLKTLRSRWEFSSATGTPIHPDASEDALLAAAIRMKEAEIPSRHRVDAVFNKRSNTSSPNSKVSRPQDHDEDEAEDLHEASTERRSLESPILHERQHSSGSDSFDDQIRRRSPPYIQDEAVGDDSLMTSDDESGEELGDASRIIDRAFDFMDPHCAFKTPSPSKAAEQQREECNDARMPYSVSFYRKVQRERTGGNQTPSGTNFEPSAPPCQSITPPELLKNDAAAKIRRMRREVQIQEEHISQSSRALAMCRERLEFRGSREEIEMQRALLMATQKLRALTWELKRFDQEAPKKREIPLGDVTVTLLAVNLSRDYVQSQLSRNPNDVYHFVALLKCQDQVEVTKLAVGDEAVRQKGLIEFKMPLHLRSLSPSFVAVVEIYGIRTNRERISHEEKYGLKGATLKGKRSKSALNPPMYSCSMESNFSLLGAFSFDIRFDGSRKAQYVLHQPIHPLDGTVAIKIKKKAVGGTDANYRGFLSMHQRTREGLGTWNRYWCVLDNGEMRFWRHPEDVENQKPFLVSLDLATCVTSDGASTVTDVCPFPNSFQIDVWVPKEGGQRISMLDEGHVDEGCEKFRVLLAADTQVDMSSWMLVVNTCTRQLCTWRNYNA